MKNKDKNEKLKTMSEADLTKLVSDSKEALRVFRFGIAGSRVKNVKEGDKLRKGIARALTEISLRRKLARATK